jgi:NAD(P)-dependent dehydrogenase (short-subunit alcohol dehydrogenase family)
MAGARVIIACRDTKKAEEAADDIRRDTKGVEGSGQVVVVSLDLASLASVRQCAQHLLRTERAINILVNNAGKAAPLLTIRLFISSSL